MELPANEIAAIKAMVDRWTGIDSPGNQQELEATFGKGGRVDATTFLAIAQRLQDRGYKAVQEDDRLSILTQKNIRISLQGIGVLETYCKTNVISNIQGQEFSALRKRNNSEKDTLEIEEYDVKIKSRTEETVRREDPELQELFRDWANQPKAFRLIKRWSLFSPGMRIDMSIVRSTPKINGEFQWRKDFLAPYRIGNQNKTLFQVPLHYEVEVELIHGSDMKSKDVAIKTLIRGIGEVLRAMQGNSLLIRKSVQKRILQEYAGLNRGSPNFRGNPPVTLERVNMEEPIKVSATKEGGGVDEGATMEEEMEGGAKKREEMKKKEAVLQEIPNIRNNYNVTDKADGLRCLGFVNGEGEFYLIDMAMRVYRTGLQNTACKNSLVDGEWIKKDRDGDPMNQYGIFDIFVIDKTDISRQPFANFIEDEVNEEDDKSRFGNMTLWIKRWKDKDHFKMIPSLTELTRLNVLVKTFRFADPSKPTSIFEKCQIILNTEQAYHTDGLILTPNNKPLPPIGKTFLQQFKWKPAADNTVDFLVEIDPKTYLGTNPDDSTSFYKQLTLLVNARKDPAYDNPRQTVLYMLPLPESTEWNADRNTGKKIFFKPSQFIPTNPPDSMASRCYLDVQTQPLTGEEYVVAENGEPISNNSIVEMRYDITRAPGRRWIPMRIRHDKTERYMRAIEAGSGDLKQTLNAEITANSIWSSIHNPITKSMICTGASMPSEAEMIASASSRYYNRRASKKDLEVIQGLRAFHNKYIKQQILYGSVMRTPGLTVLDLACGQAGDIHIWYEAKASTVLGVDVAMEGLRDKKNGAYARYMNYMIQHGRSNVPRMLFIHGNSSKRLTDGTAGIPLTPGSTEEGDMLKVILGTGDPKGKIPPFVSKEPVEGGVRGALGARADVASCMFALHYFFEDKPTLDGFLQNLQECVKMGGYFIACFTDGERVFNMLKGKKDLLATRTDKDVLIWSIRGDYDVPELPKDETSLGLPIDVKFISLGEESHREYLVSYPYLIKRLNESGFRLLNAEELKAVGLEHSTNTFDKSYEMIGKEEKRKYPMSNQIRDYSFTNRWIIVKRDDVLAIDEDEDGGDGFGGSITKSVGFTDGAELAEAENEVLGNEVVNAELLAQEEAAKKAVSAARIAKYGTVVGTPLTGAEDEWGGGGKKMDIWSHSSDYKPESVFLFGPEVSLTANVLEREDKFYPRKLSPISQFMIKEEGKDIEYPSLEHFWAAMKVLHAGACSKASKTALAESFSCEGSIHSEAKERLTKEVKEKHALSTQNQARMKIAIEELGKIQTALNKISYDDAKWIKLRNKYIRYGLEQRWKHDAEFHKTVEDLRLKNAYLLYSIGPHLGDSTGLLAGKIRKDRTIDGDNLIGKIIMELAKYKV